MFGEKDMPDHFSKQNIKVHFRDKSILARMRFACVWMTQHVVITTTIFGTSATYYDVVNIKGFGFGAGLRF